MLVHRPILNLLFSCEKGRVLVRQGHDGYNFYFVYSGSAFVQKEKVDEQTGKKQLVTENVIDQGACFGVSNRNINPPN